MTTLKCCTILDVRMMKATRVTPMTHNYDQQLQHEIDMVPEEYKAALINIVHAFREGVVLKNAEESFKEGWSDVMQDNTSPIDSLWDGIDD